jgi:protein-S-isoprenylcysteine O-methyltransferase Ste14
MFLEIDDFMRAAFVIQIVSIGIIRSMFAGLQIGETKGRKWKESYAFVIGGIPLAIVFYYAFFGYLFSSDLQWMYLGLPSVVRWVGFSASLAVVGLFTWIFKTIGTAGAKYVITFDDMKLATNGPYSRVRHPMYAAFFLWGITALLFTNHWGVGGTVIALSVALAILRAPHEERVLIEHFGDEYRQYMARTSRFLPFSSRREPPAF